MQLYAINIPSIKKPFPFTYLVLITYNELLFPVIYL